MLLCKDVLEDICAWLRNLMLLVGLGTGAKCLHNYLSGCRLTTYAVGEKLCFLPTWALSIFTDMLEAARCRSSSSLARWAKLSASFHAGRADFITSCSKRSKSRATEEPVSHLTILVPAFCQCSAGTTCNGHSLSSTHPADKQQDSLQRPIWQLETPTLSSLYSSSRECLW